MESANVTPECLRERHGDEQDRASGGANFFDRMSACAPSGFSLSLHLASGSASRALLSRVSGFKTEGSCATEGDRGELLHSAAGTSSAVKVTL